MKNIRAKSGKRTREELHCIFGKDYDLSEEEDFYEVSRRRSRAKRSKAKIFSERRESKTKAFSTQNSPSVRTANRNNVF